MRSNISSKLIFASCVLLAAVLIACYIYLDRECYERVAHDLIVKDVVRRPRWGASARVDKNGQPVIILRPFFLFGALLSFERD